MKQRIEFALWSKIPSLVRPQLNELHYSFSYEGPKSCKQWELTFLSTISFRATKTLSTVGVDIPVDGSFQSYQNLVNFNCWHSCSFLSHLTPGRCHALQTYENPVNSGGWHSFRLYSFQSYLTAERHYASRKLSELTTVAVGATLKKRNTISSLFRAKFPLLLL